ncbi:MAG TPA: hypothetical protein VK576_10985, partial [Thermoleophilia bacterium]|nr:hypothetical protein [Thermoleophilia bacterium]
MNGNELGGHAVPRRFRNWILFWTPMTWLALALIMYPKDRPLIVDTSVYPAGEAPVASLGSAIGGFFAPTIGNFPAWVLWLGAAACFGYAAFKVPRRLWQRLLVWSPVAWVMIWLLGSPVRKDEL